LVSEVFGAAALGRSAIAPHLIDGQKDLDKAGCARFGHGIEVIRTITRTAAFPRWHSASIAPPPSDQKVIIALLERYVPENVEYTLLFESRQSRRRR